MLNTQSMGGGWLPNVTANQTISGASPTTVTVSMQGAPLPATLTLISADANRAIKLSSGANNSNHFFTPSYDQTNGNMLVVVVTCSVKFAQFTGTTGDTWGVV